MADKKTLSAVFSAKDDFTSIAKKIAEEGKKTTLEIKAMKSAIEQGASSEKYEQTATGIAASFERAEGTVAESTKNMKTSIEKGFENTSTSFGTTGDKIEKFTKTVTEGVTKSKEEVERFNKSIKGISSIDNSEKIELELDYINKKIKIQESMLSNLQSEYKKTAESMGETSTKALKLQERLLNSTNSIDKLKMKSDRLKDTLNSFKNEFTEAEKEVRDFGNEAEKTSKKTKDFGDDAEEVAKKVDDISKVSETATKTIAAIGTGLAAAFGISAVSEFVDSEMKAMNQFQSRVGAGVEEMRIYKSEIKELYGNGMGESIEDTANSMATVKVNTGLIGEELKNTTNDALLLRDVFDFDINESTRSAKMMMDQFGASAKTSYSLIAQGAQNGLDKNGDLLDSINEYSVHFKQLGFDAEDMLNMLVNGSASGTFSVDKLGDSIKEFGIRAIDGSKTTIEGFTAMGLNADEMAKKFKVGGETGKAAFEETITALKAMKDPIEQNTAGVNLFGTMWEDLGAEGIFALSNINGKISETSDALEKINEVKYQDIGSAFTSLTRSLMTDFTDGFTSDADNIVDKISSMEETLSPIAKSIGENVGGVIETVGDAFDFANDHAVLFKTTVSGIVGFMAARKTINGIASFTEGLGKSLKATTIIAEATTKAGGTLATFSAGLSGIALPATLAVGAISAVMVGVSAYTDWAKEKSLEEHFGSITLSMKEMENMANQVVSGGNLSKIRKSFDEFDNLESVKESISDITGELEKTEWKIGLGFELTTEENESYKNNIDSYIEQVKGYVEQQHYSSTIAIDMLFGDDEHDDIIKELNTYYTKKEAEVKNIGTELAEKVNNAYKDKVFDSKEIEDIQKLKARLAEYEQTVANSKFNGQLSGISGEYSYKDLTPETIDEFTGKLKEAAETRITAQNQARDLALSEGGLSDKSKGKIIDEYNLKNAEVYAKTTAEANKMINTSYADSLKSGYDYWYNLDLKSPFTATSGFFEKGLMDQALTSLKMETETQMYSLRDKMGEGLSGSDRSAITELFEQMKPQREELLQVSQSYLEAGQQIPDGIRAGILDNAKIGAVLNDQSSLYTLIAYNATRQNPAYADLVNKAIASGEDVPEAIKLGVELAKPGTISSAAKAGTETGNAAANALENKKEAAKNASVELMNSAKSGINSGSSGLTAAAKNAGESAGRGFLSKIKSYVQQGLKLLEVGSNGTGVDPEYNTNDVPVYNALGGIYDSPLLTWVAEAGDSEAIIPLNDTQRAFDLWQEAGFAIGKARGFDFKGNAFDYSPSYNMTSTSNINTAKTIVLKIEGGGEIKIPNTLSKQDVLNMLMDNLEPTLIDIINQQLYEEGDGSYET